MSNTIYLDPEKTAPLEPFEGDSRNGSWISPFDIPEQIELGSQSPDFGILDIRFHYPGGETGQELTSLDPQFDPPAWVVMGRLSGKILELKFNTPIDESDFPRIADCLNRRAVSLPHLATRFNFRMIASILQNWSRFADSSD